MLLRVSLLLCSLAAAAAFAQDSASLSITVYDPSGALVPAANVTLTDLQRGRVVRALTEATGFAEFSFLQPSAYSLTVEKPGFQTYKIESMMLAVRDRQTMRVELKVGAAGTTTIVVRDVSALSSDASQGSNFDQNFVENLPANGRSAESLILMTAGVTSAAGGKGGGGFNANGLRSEANYYTLDGVSVNRPLGSGGGSMGGGPGGGGPGGGGPGMMGGGGPMMGGGGDAGGGDSISLEAMQEMKVQTSSFAPEFGRSPGAQVVMTSRGGTNAWHGSVFDYARRDSWNANDWFANSAGFSRGRERETRAGATLAGPVWKSKTYFFANYEQLELLAPQSINAVVPDLASRTAASAQLQPYLNAFPIPNSASLTGNGASYRGVVSNPSDSRSASLRLDHTWSDKTTIFARYSMSNSSGTSRGSESISPNIVSDSTSHSRTATAGVTHDFGESRVNDTRVSYSTNSMRGHSWMDSFGGAVPLTDDIVFPSGVTSATGQFSMMLMGFAGLNYGGHNENQQQQVNVVDSFSRVSGKHHAKFGVDYRRTLLTNYSNPYTNSISFNGVSGYDWSFLSGYALNSRTSSNTEWIYPTYMNLSVYGQDTYRATERTTVTWGLRWDLNPAPTNRDGLKPLTASGDTVTDNKPIYPARRFNIAPRVGVAYMCDDTPGREKMLRAGFGVFYDMGYGGVSQAFSGAPYSNIITVSKTRFPLYTYYQTPPGLPVSEPYGQVITGDSDLKTPRVYQWSTSWEQYFGHSNMLNVTITGNKGTNQLRTTTTPVYSDYYDILSTISNGGSSSYNGLQIQYRRRMSRALQVQVSYTWAHSFDSSSGGGGGGGFSTLFNGGDSSSSDYDVRHALSVSGSYELPAPAKGHLYAPLRDWHLDFSAYVRSGLPFDIMGVSSSSSSTTTTSAGLFAQVRPDYTGEAVWITDASAPGGRRLNPDAFSIPSGYTQGNLGRNALRGFNFNQVDLALRRTIPFGERFKLNISGTAYNALNHPNFANPSTQEGGNMSSPVFGMVTRMMNQGGMGGGGSIYRTGGPRAIEVMMRLSF